QASDHHGTAELAIKATDLSLTRRKTDPFGNPRGTQPAWPTTHGFVNGTIDPTGLTHLGAREYEPTTGRFISPDQIIDVGDPIQMNGYAYANNGPVTGSDSTGLCRDDPGTPCGDGHMHDGNGLDGPPASTHPCGTPCGPAGW